ncbi:MAG TPA: GNAT family N-acetyltransferase [Streptosporangiaceae bacterium]
MPRMGAYRPADRDAVIALWSRVFPADPVPAERFDALLAAAGPDALTLAWEDAEPAGFVLAQAERPPGALPGVAGGPAGASGSPARGWLTAFGVRDGSRRRGLGRALIDAAVARLRAAGCATVRTGGPGEAYLVPGVDTAAYPAAAPLLGAAGFRPAGTVHGMARGLSAPLPPADPPAGVRYRAPAPGELPALAAMVAAALSPSWASVVRAAPPELLLVAYAGRQPVGFAGSDLYAGCPGRFGPIGVSGDWRGSGIGRGLLDRTLTAMRDRGHRRAWFLWAPDSPAGQAMYRSAGFATDRSFQLLDLDLHG